MCADKRVIVWNLHDTVRDDGSVGYARRALTGHSQCVQDVVISGDTNFALSGSWDKTLRLWDLNVGETVRTFQGHTSDVNSVAFSADNRQIVSGSRDRTVKLWNTLAQCKYTITENQHTDWVSCVRFSPSLNKPLIVSCGWDKLVKVSAPPPLLSPVPGLAYPLRRSFARAPRLRGYTNPKLKTPPSGARSLLAGAVRGEVHMHACVFERCRKRKTARQARVPGSTRRALVSRSWPLQVWSLTDCTLKKNLLGHSSVLYTVTISPDGSLCASGGKDGVAMLWDVQDGKHLYSLDANCTINDLCFSPCNYWLCAATDKSVKVSRGARCPP